MGQPGRIRAALRGAGAGLLGLACGTHARSDAGAVDVEPAPAPVVERVMPASPAAPPVVSPVLRRASVQNVLLAECGSCHGSASADAGAGIDYIDDIDRLSFEGLIVPCDPEASPLVESIRAGRMPPAETQRAVPDAEIDAIVCGVAERCDRPDAGTASVSAACARAGQEREL